MEEVVARTARLMESREWWRSVLIAIYAAAGVSLVWSCAGAAWVATARLVLQGLGLAFAVCFFSLRTQLLGLVGPEGILPADAYVRSCREAVSDGAARRARLLATVQRAAARNPELGEQALARLPRADLRLAVQRGVLKTLELFGGGASERGLLLLCDAGAACSVALVVAPGCAAQPALLAVAWWCYLVLKRTCRDFLNLQWDALLLEMAVLAWPLSVPGALPLSLPPCIWCLHLLLFKLMFSSGVCKLRSNCPSWRSLTAMTYHYQTQPLPHVLSWHAHGLPVWVHRLSAAATLVLELPVPLLIFCGGIGRLSAFLATAGLMVLIVATGNYGCFNWLTLVLAVSLLSDEQLAMFGCAGDAATADATANTLPAALQYFHLLVCWTAVIALGLSASVPLTAVGRFGTPPLQLPAAITDLHTMLAPLGTGKGYGLFAQMTTFRWELVFQGSDQSEGPWAEYQFPHKPGRVDRHPLWVFPGHMPRLDWQLWFVPLKLARGGSLPPWCDGLLLQLLKGSAAVRAGMLREDPFHGRAPRYIRVTLHDYRFSNCRHSREPSAQPARAALANHCARFGVSHDGPRQVEGAPWEGDEGASWWRRQLVQEVGTFALEEGSLSRVG